MPTFATLLPDGSPFSAVTPSGFAAAQDLVMSARRMRSEDDTRSAILMLMRAVVRPPAAGPLVADVAEADGTNLVPAELSCPAGADFRSLSLPRGSLADSPTHQCLARWAQATLPPGQALSPRWGFAEPDLAQIGYHPVRASTAAAATPAAPAPPSSGASGPPGSLRSLPPATIVLPLELKKAGVPWRRVLAQGTIYAFENTDLSGPGAAIALCAVGSSFSRLAVLDSTPGARKIAVEVTEPVRAELPSSLPLEEIVDDGRVGAAWDINDNGRVDGAALGTLWQTVNAAVRLLASLEYERHDPVPRTSLYVEEAEAVLASALVAMEATTNDKLTHTNGTELCAGPDLPALPSASTQRTRLLTADLEAIPPLALGALLSWYSGVGGPLESATATPEVVARIRALSGLETPPGSDPDAFSDSSLVGDEHLASMVSALEVTAFPVSSDVMDRLVAATVPL